MEEEKGPEVAGPAVVQIAQAPHDPVPVTIASTVPVEQPKTTTDEIALKTEGQRAINLIWEKTQSKLAVMLLGAGVAVCSFILIWAALHPESKELMSLAQNALLVFNGSIASISTFYFVRTNHTQRGGVGTKDDSR